MSYSWINEQVHHLGYRFVPSGHSPKPSAALVAQVENLVGGSLPEDYRYFVERYGGAILGDSECRVLAPIVESCSWGSWIRPEFFHSFNTTDTANASQLLHAYHGRLPQGVLSISQDGVGNQICLDVAGNFLGAVWFWDHEQRWFADCFPHSLEEAAQEIEREGIDASRFSVHDIIRGWARLHAAELDRLPDYMGMYRMANSFADFLRSLRRVRYDLD